MTRARVGMGVRVGYRSLQAIYDLRAMAAGASAGTLARLAERGNGAVTVEDLRTLIRAQRCRLSPGFAGTAHHALLLAATLPDEDFDAFRIATAILIADRLQGGAGEDDLFWHWDAFQAQYRTLEDDERAAVLQGYRRLQSEGLLTLHDPPEGEWMSTLTHARALAELEAMKAAGAGDLATRARETLLTSLQADDSALRPAAELWTADGPAILGLADGARRPIVQAMRHIYESRQAWHAYRGRRFDPSKPMPAMLPNFAAPAR